MQSRKTIFLVMIIPLLAMVAFSQNYLNKQRGELSVTYLETMPNSDPLLKFTAEALGGFRGVIAMVLWHRLNNLQMEGKFLEMVQLSEWVTKLQPHTPTVWTDRAWNLAYNVSVKETDINKRYKWVMAGISLLRDEAIQYNPHEPQLYWELGWQFKHKMGADMDSAHRIYKRKWINEMTTNIWPSVQACVDAKGKPDWNTLLNPQTKEDKARVKNLIRKYKLNPRKMKQVDDEMGTVMAKDTDGKSLKNADGEQMKRHVGLEWRLPETQCIYWAWMGEQKCRENTTRRDTIKKLKRLGFQAMQLSARRGRLIVNPHVPDLEDAYLRGNAMRFGPRLDFIPQAESEYRQALEEAKKAGGKGYDPATLATYRTAHHNFLRTAIKDLYLHNRIEEAKYWFRMLVDEYPDKVYWYIGFDREKKTMEFETFVLSEIEESLKRGNRDAQVANLSGLIMEAYYRLAEGEEDFALGRIRAARAIYDRFSEKRSDTDVGRVDLPEFQNLHDQALLDVLKRMSDTEPYMASALRERLGLKEKEVPNPGLPNIMNPFREKKGAKGLESSPGSG